MTNEAFDYEPARTTTSGWVVFSGVVIAIAAIANLIYGLANTALTVGWLLWGRWSRRAGLSGLPGARGLDPAL